MSHRSTPGLALLLASLSVVAVSGAGLVPEPLAAGVDQGGAEGDPVVRLYVDTTNLTVGRAGYLEALEDAVRFWENDPEGLLDEPVALAWTDDPSKADVRVWFLDQARMACGPSTTALGCGRAPTEDRPGKMVITLRRLDGGAFRSYPYVGHIAGHELGHALGLDHAPGSGVMHQQAAPDQLSAPSPQPLSPSWWTEPEGLAVGAALLLWGRALWRREPGVAAKGFLEAVAGLELVPSRRDDHEEVSGGTSEGSAAAEPVGTVDMGRRGSR